MIYFDNNATTKLDKSALGQMMIVVEECYNPSSAHYYGRKARILIEKSRKNILDFLGAARSKLVFTSSGTEANNLIMSNFSQEEILISSIEHPSVHNLAKYYVNVNNDGLVNLEELRIKLAQGGYKLLSVIYANNETGVIQNIKEIAKIAHEFGCLIHSDISQAIGKIPVDLEHLGIDFATFSAHKFRGPLGCGGLIYRSDFNLQSQILGGGQEMGIRSGTENIAAIIGTSSALDRVILDDYVLKLRDYLEDEILNYAPDALILSKKAMRLPNTSMIIMPNVDFNIQVMQFDLENIAISSGSACASARITSSRIVSAMNIDEKIAKNAIRVSLSSENNIEEIKKFIEIWKKLYNKGNRI